MGHALPQSDDAGLGTAKNLFGSLVELCCSSHLRLSVSRVAHLLAVAAYGPRVRGDEHLAISALWHDSVEDQDGKARLNDVRNRFGERVARIVEACSDSLADTGKEEPKAHWRERKEAYLAHQV